VLNELIDCGERKYLPVGDDKQAQVGAPDLEAARAINDDADARIARLHAILKALERSHFGRRSERAQPPPRRGR
jgi:hypothetical protein